MNVEDFMKKHGDLKKIDTDGSLTRNIESIFKILSSPNYIGLEDQRKTDLVQQQNILKIDLILLMSA